MAEVVIPSNPADADTPINEEVHDNPSSVEATLPGSDRRPYAPRCGGPMVTLSWWLPSIPFPPAHGSP
jgi:hypothetical protein